MNWGNVKIIAVLQGFAKNQNKCIYKVIDLDVTGGFVCCGVNKTVFS